MKQRHARFRLPRGAKASWMMLVFTWLLWMMNANDREIMFRAQPSIISEWHISGSAWGLMVAWFFLAYALIALPAGIFADKIGRGWRRKISQVWYMIIFTTVSILIGIRATSSQLWEFILWRVIGMGAAGGAEVTNVAQCSEFWPREDRGFALGLHHTGYPIGALLGGLASAAILSAFGSENWRYIFLITPLIGYLLALALWLFSNEKTYESVNRYAIEHGLTPPSAEGATQTSFAEQWQYCKEALSNRSVLLTVIAAALINFAQTIGLWFLAPYVVFTMGKSVAAGAIIGVVPYITGWIGQLVWGTISDYIGRRTSLTILSLWYMVSVLLLTQVRTLPLLWGILLFWGLALNAVFPVYYAMMADHAPKASGSAMGLLLMLVFLGSVPAAPLAGILIQSLGGWGVANGYIVGFFVAAAASLLATLLQWFGTSDVRREEIPSFQREKISA